MLSDGASCLFTHSKASVGVAASQLIPLVLPAGAVSQATPHFSEVPITVLVLVAHPPWHVCAVGHAAYDVTVGV